MGLKYKVASCLIIQIFLYLIKGMVLQKLGTTIFRGFPFIHEFANQRITCATKTIVYNDLYFFTTKKFHRRSWLDAYLILLQVVFLLCVRYWNRGNNHSTVINRSLDLLLSVVKTTSFALCFHTLFKGFFTMLPLHTYPFQTIDPLLIYSILSALPPFLKLTHLTHTFFHST